MKTKLSLSISLLLLAIFVSACGSQSATPTAEIVPIVSHGGPVEDYVSLIDSLRGAGAIVEPGDQVEQAFFIVKGQIIKVNGADVQVFEYENAEAMEADAAHGLLNSSIGTTTNIIPLAGIITPDWHC